MGLNNTTDLLCLQFLGTPARNFCLDLATSQRVTGTTTGTEQVGNTGKFLRKGGLSNLHTVIYLDNHLARALINRLTNYINILDPFTYLFLFLGKSCILVFINIIIAKCQRNEQRTDNGKLVQSLLNLQRLRLPPSAYLLQNVETFFFCYLNRLLCF